MNLFLRKTEPVWSGLLRLARQDLDRITPTSCSLRRNSACLVHRLRISIKRLRALWRLLGPHLDQQQVAWENQRLREAAQRLSGVRDRTMSVATLRSLMDDADATARRVIRQSIRQLQRQPALPIRRGRTDTSAPILSHPNSSAVSDALGVLCQSVRTLGHLPKPNCDGWELLEPGLRKSYARARKGWRQVRCAHRLECPEDQFLFHDWRKDVKRLFYQIEPLEASWPGQLRRMLGNLSKLGHFLGDYHDLQVVQELLNFEAQSSMEPGVSVIMPLLAHRQHQLSRRARHRARRCLKAKPKTWISKLRRHFLDWHQTPTKIA